MWREQDYLHPRALLGYFPCNAVGNSLELYAPEEPDQLLEKLVFPRQPGHDRICITDFYRPKESGERDVVAIQAVTAGSRRRRSEEHTSELQSRLHLVCRLL